VRAGSGGRQVARDPNTGNVRWAIFQIGIVHDAYVSDGMRQRRAQRRPFPHVALTPSHHHAFLVLHNSLWYSPVPSLLQSSTTIASGL